MRGKEDRTAPKDGAKDDPKEKKPKADDKSKPSGDKKKADDKPAAKSAPAKAKEPAIPEMPMEDMGVSPEMIAPEMPDQMAAQAAMSYPAMMGGDADVIPVDEGKIDQASIHYRQPGEVCAGCVHYLDTPDGMTPPGCDVVAGDINPEGNCMLFMAGGASEMPLGAEMEEAPIEPMIEPEVAPEIVEA